MGRFSSTEPKPLLHVLLNVLLETCFLETISMNCWLSHPPPVLEATVQILSEISIDLACWLLCQTCDLA